MANEATIRGVGVSMGEGGMGAPAVLLDVRDEIIPIFVGGGQAQEIERARQGMPAERPMTHDLFVDVLDDVDVTIEQVRIDNLADETFYAKLDLTVDRDGETEKIVRDARPSDGIALAVRVECPVMVADEVIDTAGQSPETLGIEEPGQSPSKPSGAGLGVGTRSSESSEQEERESIDLDDAVSIDIQSEKDEQKEDQDDDPEA